MAFLDEHKAKFDNLRVNLESKNRDQLRSKANGGNTILFSYLPSEEKEYMDHARQVLADEAYKFIDVAALFVEFIEKTGLDKIENRYKIYRATPHKVFSSGETGLADMIVQKIRETDQEGFIPVMVRTGALHGTGIENVNIMEHKDIMKLNNPLIIFYPAKTEDENLFFLNFKPASKYRCTVI